LIQSSLFDASGRILGKGKIHQQSAFYNQLTNHRYSKHWNAHNSL
jgi:hypothetical protein